MKKAFFLVALAVALLLSCRHHESKSFSKTERIDIDETISDNSEVNELIAPYKGQIEGSLNTVLSHAPKSYSKHDGELNTALGNMMADAVFMQCNPIFNERAGKSMDFVLLNHGGIRSSIQRGPIKIRNVFELMPFENKVVVAALRGEQIQEMVSYLQKSHRAHPISRGLNIVLTEDYQLISASINELPIDPERVYFVGTSDYLFNGGDHMSFFSNNQGHYNLDYKVRNAIIDYIQKTDTLELKRDQRFIRKGRS